MDTAWWVCPCCGERVTKLVREKVWKICEGCGKPYEISRPNQKYCDVFCRARTNSRNYYNRNRATT